MLKALNKRYVVITYTFMHLLASKHTFNLTHMQCGNNFASISSIYGLPCLKVCEVTHRAAFHSPEQLVLTDTLFWKMPKGLNFCRQFIWTASSSDVSSPWSWLQYLQLFLNNYLGEIRGGGLLPVKLQFSQLPLCRPSKPWGTKLSRALQAK